MSSEPRKNRGTRAVLFDFGGTLYDYSTLSAGDSESLVELARSVGVDAAPGEIVRAHRESLRRAYEHYLHKPSYLHRHFFRDAVRGMVETFGKDLTEERYERYKARQWELHKRDFALREGVPETLEEIRRRGIHLGIVSNIDADQLLFMGEIAGLERWFDAMLSSEEAGSCKPDPGIYRQALAQAGCGPEEALFIGDSIDQDIAGANAMGIRSVLIWHRRDRPPPDREPRPSHVITRFPEVLDLL